MYFIYKNYYISNSILNLLKVSLVDFIKSHQYIFSPLKKRNSVCY